jgi:alkaline phosphatase D
VCETLDDFRGAFAYNLLDDNLRAFAASVPQINQWDDHETHNNWYPGQILADDRYTERRADVLAARAHQAFFEWLPIAPRQRDEFGRIYRRISHGPLLDLFILDIADVQGPQRARRLRRPERRHARPGPAGMARARAGRLEGDVEGDRQRPAPGVVVPDTPGTFEGVSQGDNGPPLGRELEFAEVLRFAHQRQIGGIVFLTADVHCTSAHHYDPARAAIGDFTPFWEFVSGPLNAGAFGPNALDTTFGPQTVFSAAPPVANTSPADGFQFFGYVTIDGRTQVMTVSLRDLDGKELFSVDLTP